MQVEDRTDERGPVVHLSGRLDAAAAEDLVSRLLPRLVARGPALRLDMAAVDYVGGAGLRGLLLLSGWAHDLALPFTIENPSPVLRQACAVGGVGPRLLTKDAEWIGESPLQQEPSSPRRD